MKYLLSLTAFILSATAYTQPTTKDYETKTIYAVGSKYLLNNKPIDLTELVAAINKKSAAGGMFATDGYKDWKRSKLLNGIGFGLSVAGILLIGGTTNNNYSPRRVNVALGLTFASLVPSTFAARFRKKSAEKITKAIWLYNRDVLFTN